VPDSTLQVPINEGNSAVLVLPGLKLGVGDARVKYATVQKLNQSRPSAIKEALCKYVQLGKYLSQMLSLAGVGC
jgi:hypothetical protein